MNEIVDHAPIIIVAGMSKQTRAIGNSNELLWHVPDDLKRFKDLTTGHPIIMGRKTFESILAILGKPLPSRTNIVITRNPDYKYEGVTVVDSFAGAIEKAQAENPTEIHIGGGEEMYKMALPHTGKIFLTQYDDDKDGDAHFPIFEDEFTEVMRHGAREHNGLSYEWIDYIRK